MCQAQRVCSSGAQEPWGDERKDIDVEKTRQVARYSEFKCGQSYAQHVRGGLEESKKKTGDHVYDWYHAFLAAERQA